MVEVSDDPVLAFVHLALDTPLNEVAPRILKHAELDYARVMHQPLDLALFDAEARASRKPIFQVVLYGKDSAYPAVVFSRNPSAGLHHPDAHNVSVYVDVKREELVAAFRGRK
jgi:hypothetical protein